MTVPFECQNFVLILTPIWKRTVELPAEQYIVGTATISEIGIPLGVLSARTMTERRVILYL